MNCKKVILELTSYLDGVLDSTMRIDLEQHLSRCTDCRLVVDTCRKTIQIFCNSEPVPLPEDVRQAPAHGAPRALPTQREDDLAFKPIFLFTAENGHRIRRSSRPDRLCSEY